MLHILHQLYVVLVIAQAKVFAMTLEQFRNIHTVEGEEKENRNKKRKKNEKKRIKCIYNRTNARLSDT